MNKVYECTFPNKKCTYWGTSLCTERLCSFKKIKKAITPKVGVTKKQLEEV